MELKRKVYLLLLSPIVVRIYRLTGYAQYPDSLRTLGVNAARLVKGNPFVSDERLEVAF